MKEYILIMLKNGTINFKWAGRDNHLDCVSFESEIFTDAKFKIFIPQMEWDNIEEYLAEKLAEYIQRGELVLVNPHDCTAN